MSPTTPRSKLRVVIVEDHALFAESLELALTLEGYDARRVPVGQQTTPQATLDTVNAARPQIVLLDLDLGKAGDGSRMIGPLAKAGIHVVVVTASNDRARWGESLRNGARRVLSKAQPLNDILATVRRIHQGLPVMDRHEREELISYWRERGLERAALQRRLALLTPREETVLGELMLGRTVREIAAQSVVSEATVRTQVKAILAKLEVSSQIAAVGLANTVGWHAPSNS